VRTFFAAIACTLLLPTLAQAQTPEFVSIKGDQINIRKQPSTSATKAWTMEHGYPLQVQERKDQWLKVKDHEETLGWVYAPLTATTPHRLIIANAVNLRAGPGKKHKVVAKLEHNEVVRTVGNQGEWSQVERDNGQTGWVAKRLTWGW